MSPVTPLPFFAPLLALAAVGFADEPLARHPPWKGAPMKSSTVPTRFLPTLPQR